MPDTTHIIRAIVSHLLDNSRPLVSPVTKTEWALSAFIGLCAAADVFFLAMALYQYLTRMFPPSGAALVSAAVFLAAAVVAAIIRKLLIHEQKSKQKSAEDELKEKIHHLMTSLFNELEEPIRDHPMTSVTIATLAGMLTGRRI